MPRIFAIASLAISLSTLGLPQAFAGSAIFQFNSNGVSIQIGNPPAEEDFEDIEPADEGFSDDAADSEDYAEASTEADGPTAITPAIFALHVADCRIRYKTYRLRDNSFMSLDGYRKPCRSQWVQ